MMYSPAATTPSRSTPVSTPNPSSMYTTSSVATLPVAPGAYGQPPSPGDEAGAPVSTHPARRSAPPRPGARTCDGGVDGLDAQGEGLEDVGEALAVRVVEVHRERGRGDPRAQHRLHHRPHRPRRPHPDRVPERHLVVV